MPAFLFILALFLTGLLFLQGRRVSEKLRMRSPAFAVALIGLAGLLFFLPGKIAVLIAILLLAVTLLSSKAL